MDNKFYVYVYLDPNRPGHFEYGIDFIFNFEPFYVGKGSGYRCYVGLKDDSNSKIKFSKIKSILKSGSMPIIHKIFENIHEDEANAKEISLISQIGKKIDGTGPLVNITNGGEGMSGYKHKDIWKKHLSKPVYQYDKNGLFISEYNSIKEASESTGVKKQNIGACASGKYASSGGFIWKFKDNKLQSHLDFKPIMPKHSDETKEKISISNSKRIYQFNMNGDFIKEWSSTVLASKELKIRQGSISSCLNGKYLTAGGYIWRKTHEVVEPVTKEKVILQLSKDGALIKEWSSANKIETELGYNKTMIRACCRGVKNTCKGFIWKYKSN